MSNDYARLANMMGAFANGVTDRIRAAVTERVDLGGEAAAAMIVLGHEPGLSIDQLGKVLRLSHPGTVRLVDRLVAAGLAERKPSLVDRRFLSLHLTQAGEKERAAVLEGRRAVLAPLLDLVAPDDLPVLERAIEKMLVSLPSDATTAMSVCRYCDQGQCANCPMEQFGSVAECRR